MKGEIFPAFDVRGDHRRQRRLCYALIAFARKRATRPWQTPEGRAECWSATRELARVLKTPAAHRRIREDARQG